MSVLCTASADGLKLWEEDGSGMTLTGSLSHSPSSHIAWNAAHSLLATANPDGVVVFDAKGGDQGLCSSPSEVKQCGFSTDSKHLVGVDARGVVRSWEANSNNSGYSLSNMWEVG